MKRHRVGYVVVGASCLSERGDPMPPDPLNTDVLSVPRSLLVRVYM